MCSDTHDRSLIDRQENILMSEVEGTPDQPVLTAETPKPTSRLGIEGKAMVPRAYGSILFSFFAPPGGKGELTGLSESTDGLR